MKMIGIMKYGQEKCPKCKEENLRFDTYWPVDDSLRQNVDCVDCGFSFELWAEQPKYWEVFSDVKKRGR